MKVKMTMTVEVNSSDWADEYGLSHRATAVREDVRSYLLSQIQGAHAVECGLITKVEVR